MPAAGEHAEPGADALETRARAGDSQGARQPVIVLDASVVVELLLTTDRGRTVADRIAPMEETLHAPHLIDLEVTQALRRYAATGRLSESRAQQALEDLVDLDMARYPHAMFLDRVWTLRHNATAYDAAYIALAEALEAPLLTSDTALASVPDTRARVELV